jgi:transcription-repair coupling factor (superfamily II helicase)
MHLPSIAPGKRLTLPRPFGSADALLLARWAASHRDEGRMVAVVTAEPGDSQRLADEIAFFEPGLRVVVFPDWETLPYDSFSPHQDLVSERLATLWRVMQRDVDVLLAPATTSCTRIAPPAFLAGTTFHFRQKARLDAQALKAQLTLAGYQHVSQVVAPGEYAVRGSLIDLYPMGSAVPYRVDLYDDEVDSIRTFDPDTQRSLYPVPEVRLLLARAGASRSRATRRAPASTRTSPRASPPAASSTTCHSSSTSLARSWATCASTMQSCCTARSTRRCRPSGRTRGSATASSSTTRSGRCCRRNPCSCARRPSSPPRMRIPR